MYLRYSCESECWKACKIALFSCKMKLRPKPSNLCSRGHLEGLCLSHEVYKPKFSRGVSASSLGFAFLRRGNSEQAAVLRLGLGRMVQYPRSAVNSEMQEQNVAVAFLQRSADKRKASSDRTRCVSSARVLELKFRGDHSSFAPAFRSDLQLDHRKILRKWMFFQAALAQAMGTHRGTLGSRSRICLPLSDKVKPF